MIRYSSNYLIRFHQTSLGVDVIFSFECNASRRASKKIVVLRELRWKRACCSSSLEHLWLLWLLWFISHLSLCPAQLEVILCQTAKEAGSLLREFTWSIRCLIVSVKSPEVNQLKAEFQGRVEIYLFEEFIVSCNGSSHLTFQATGFLSLPNQVWTLSQIDTSIPNVIFKTWLISQWK